MLPHGSVAFHVRVAVNEPPVPLVTVLTTVIVALPELSVAVGVLNVHASQPTVLLGEQVITGGIVSEILLICCVQEFELPHLSVAYQVRVTVEPQGVDTVESL